MGAPKHRYDKRRRYQRYHCRCSRDACQARRVFPAHPDWYVKRRHCRFCGNSKWYIDRYRTMLEKQIASRVTCRCAAAHYPHRRAWCLKHE